MNQERLLDISGFVAKSLQPPFAWAGHVPYAAWLMHSLGPRIFVELGTHTGNSYFACCQSVEINHLKTKCYAVDTWAGDEHAGQYADDVFIAVNQHNQENYSGFSKLLRMPFDDATSLFEEQSVDLLHIDGLHTYEAVKHDFETWLPKLAPGAAVLFHDTQVKDRNFGVWKFWSELIEQYSDHMEFSHSHGLGVLRMPGKYEGNLLENPIPESDVNRAVLSSYFSGLGNVLVEALTAKLNERISADEVVRQNQEISSLRERIFNYEDKVVGLEAKCHNFYLENLDLTTKVNTLNLDLTSKANTLSDVYNSLSWRITKPLRYIRRVIGDRN
ncbi:class I SAM-dependent methyltransferase [Polynucleobacter sp. UB-Raua-W9]|uniref:class I SAM-dependent methyltransferase n=1 Tax=Polynucleobacter sp. UB-Raua-W9 TaxID=1819736 RepID=UPI001BFE1DDA|nr:class I SAM-dependent methyltransferase [Polynucleobacter sp. UB-Raua-W9]QWD72719.1 class I SAM-dependent methyltransferase [Polynucleobacter sp. UB-Raua-W9]